MAPKMVKVLSPKEAGALCIPERTAQTVRLWIKRPGGLPCVKDGPTGKIFIHLPDLQEFCKANRIRMIECED